MNRERGSILRLAPKRRARQTRGGGAAAASAAASTRLLLLPRADRPPGGGGVPMAFSGCSSGAPSAVAESEMTRGCAASRNRCSLVEE